MISAISSTLQVLQIYGTGCLRPLSDHIYLPHLKYAEAIPSDGYLRGAERAMAIFHDENCDIVRNIVVSFERLGCTLLEGDTIFGSLKTVQLTCAVVLLYAYDLKFT